MGRTRRVTANLPAELLEKVCRATGKGVTGTLIEGLERVKRSDSARKAARLKGRLHLAIDLDSSRERARH